MVHDDTWAKCESLLHTADFYHKTPFSINQTFLCKLVSCDMMKFDCKFHVRMENFFVLIKQFIKPTFTSGVQLNVNFLTFSSSILLAVDLVATTTNTCQASICGLLTLVPHTPTSRPSAEQATFPFLVLAFLRMKHQLDCAMLHMKY